MESKSGKGSGKTRNRFLYWSIGTKLSIVFLILVSVPLVSITYYNLTQSLDDIEDAASDSMMELSRSMSSQIELFLIENQRMSMTLAMDPTVNQFLSVSAGERQFYIDQVDQVLQNFVITHPDYDAAVLVDTGGTIIASSSGELLGLDTSFHGFYHASITLGESYISDISIGLASRTPAIFISSPVLDSGGNTLGMNVIRLNVDTIWEMIDEVSPGDYGLAFLVNEDGVIIAHPDRELVYSSLGELTPIAKAAIANTIRFGTIEGTNLPLIPESLGMDDFAEVLSSNQGTGTQTYNSTTDNTRHVAGFTTLGQNSWVVVVSMPETQFLAPLYEIESVAWLSVGLAVFFTIIASVLLVRSITKPVRRLTEKAIDVEQNKPFEPSDIQDVTSGRDEIAHLGTVFGDMVVSLRDSEERFSLFMDYMPVGVFIKDGDDKVLYVNRYIEAVFGADGWVGKKSGKQFPRKIAIGMLEDDRKALSEGYTASVETLPNRDGIERIYQIHKFTIIRKNKPTLLGVILLDITERKLVEDELRSLLEHYSDIVDSSNAIVIEIDVDGVIVFANAEAEKFVVTGEGGTRGRSIYDVIPGIFSEQMQEKITSTIDGNSVSEYESAIQRDGRHVEVSVSLVPIAGGKGKSETMLVVIRDISYMKAAENLRLETLALDEANKLKSEFLLSISHELRTPLNAVIGYSELLEDRIFGELNKKQMEHLSFIYNSGLSLLDLISNILDQSRIDAGKMELFFERLDVENLLKESQAANMSQILKKHQSVELDFEPGLTVWADEMRARQCLNNLISNAVKFTPNLGRISISAKKRGEQVEFMVVDNGSGINADKLEFIFQPFYSVEIKSGGAGLGLAITKKLVEHMGGMIHVESEEGKGSTFTFTLPSISGNGLTGGTADEQQN